jgi:hypothetical protein
MGEGEEVRGDERLMDDDIPCYCGCVHGEVFGGVFERRHASRASPTCPKYMVFASFVGRSMRRRF